MTISLPTERRENSQCSASSWPKDLLGAGMSYESTNNPNAPNRSELDTASDYGSDFSPEEQTLLNGLLDRFGSNTNAVENNHIIADVDIPDADFTASQEVALNDLLDSLPSPGAGDAKDTELTVTNIEDYEEPKGLRVPKVLGKEQWISSWERTVRVQDPKIAAVPCNGSAANGRSGPQDRERAVSTEPLLDPNVPDTRSPLERFRKPPKKALSVTDFVSPAWCEMQYFYSLSKYGRKRRTAAMKQGSAIHKTMEDQLHTTVPVEVTTKEDAWGLRFWNMIQGLRNLRETGITRELEVWGLIDGEIVHGIIDELSYTSPDPDLESSASAHYANAHADKEALPEYQRSITEYPGASISNFGPSSPTPNRKIYLSDLKTRTVPSLPSASSFRPTQMQLSLYRHVLSTLTIPSTAIPLSALAARYSFSPDTPFTDGFIAQVGSLNDIVSSQMDLEIPSTQDSFSTQDSLSLLTSHNTPSSLYTLLLTQFRATFPHGPASISPVLAAVYHFGKPSSKLGQEGESSRLIGQKSFLFDRNAFDLYIQDEMKWWRGERETKGVDIDEAWKCQGCEFRDECVWIARRQDELLAAKKERKNVAKSAV